ncbi:MAG TPA: TetR family transcriptional regulator [Pseudonocardiaceae bacterium]|jgi:AcrR family transcriptional regulator|nr:TetR family transcriptional regulator [Pseudonocardiaceae bacterium]
MARLTQQERSRRTREAILVAARRQFAAQGFSQTTIRSVAAEAEIDPSMVMRYYGSKRDLFVAATDLDLALPDLASVPAGERGDVAIRHFLALWEGEAGDDLLRILLASASTDPEAADRVRAVLAAQLEKVVAAAVDDPATARARAALVATQILGLALCRYVLRLPAVTELSPDTIISGVGPVIDLLLTERLDV